MWVILIGWVSVLFVPKLWIALILSLGLGVLCAVLVYLGEAESELPYQISVATIVVVIAPMAAVAIFLAWPFGALFRRFVLAKKSTRT